MSGTDSGSRSLTPNELMQALIRVGLIAFIAIECVQIFAPFAGIMLWALILAVTLYPLHQRLAVKLSGSDSRASTVIAVLACLALGIPMIQLALSSIELTQQLVTDFEAGTLSVPPPNDAVLQIPLVGQQIHALWAEAALDLRETLVTHEKQVRTIINWLVGSAASGMGTALVFIGAFIIAAVMMAWGRPGSLASARVIRTLAGAEYGDSVYTLSVATIRSVASGVIGVALIQALLLGIGFMLGGVPAAGLLTVVTLVLGILQLPALLISLPVIAWIWGMGDSSTVWNAVVTVYLIVAGFSDGVLKPMLLGRGVDAPMPVILLGALGGMVSMGLLGLFIGAVILAVGYQLFMAWVDHSHRDPQTPEAPEAP